MKKDQKNKLRSMGIRELQLELTRLETEKNRLECYCRHNYGSSQIIRNYPSQKQEQKIGNIRKLTKDIARIKTYLTVKLKQTA